MVNRISSDVSQCWMVQGTASSLSAGCCLLHLGEWHDDSVHRRDGNNVQLERLDIFQQVGLEYWGANPGRRGNFRQVGSVIVGFLEDFFLRKIDDQHAAVVHRSGFMKN